MKNTTKIDLTNDEEFNYLNQLIILCLQTERIDNKLFLALIIIKQFDEEVAKKCKLNELEKLINCFLENYDYRLKIDLWHKLINGDEGNILIDDRIKERNSPENTTHESIDIKFIIIIKDLELKLFVYLSNALKLIKVKNATSTF